VAGLGAVDAAVAGGGVEREQDDDDEEEVEEREGGEEADGDGHLPHRARGRSGSGRVDRSRGGGASLCFTTAFIHTPSSHPEH
jgi:hypothetical protein